MGEQTTIEGVDYGPLAVLIGTWRGDKGMDVAPEPDGDEHNAYYETIVFEAAGDVTNAEQQTLAVVRYHQVVQRKTNDEVFHDQVGYWLWDAADNSVLESFVIPRGVGVVAHGNVSGEGDEVALEVTTDDGNGSIAQAPFMSANASTTGFSHRLVVTGDSMQYSETTLLDIYDKKAYQHTDENTLRRDG
ncbi:MAG: heme-binding beta-barrel domain-containing protein [Halioglobus sp.]|nr:heme-binding beta-barrel domain-containing protein [Halioglobus sp.]